MAVSNLISNQGISFDLIRSEGTPIESANWHGPVGVLTEALFEAFWAYLSGHMLLETIAECRTGVYRNTDFASISEFKRTNLYNEFYRKIDVSHQLHTIMPVDQDVFMSCSLSRDAVDFTHDEKTQLEIISPHLSNAIENSNAFEKVVKEKSRVENVLNKMSSGAILFDEKGSVLQKTSSTEGLIQKYFAKNELDKFGIPFILRKWIKRCKFHLNGESDLDSAIPLFFENAEDHLKVSLLIENRKRRKTLVFEEKLEVSEAQINTLGLTPRESQVLLFISKGKTNPEIGFLLDISPRTVQKHAAHIFEKLGVETRTAAALRVHELH